MNNESGFKKITLARSGCLGMCPIYSIEILSDGSVNYHGDKFVKKTGSHSWKIDSESIEALNKAILKYGYFSLKAKKSMLQTSCQPSCFTSILLEDGSYREIDNDYGDEKYPKKLQRFEAEIDRLSGAEKYIRGTP